MDRQSEVTGFWRALFHLCEWEPVAVCVYELTNTYLNRRTGDSKEIHNGDATIVLYRCARCKGNKTSKLSGRWTLEQVKGESI